MNVVFHHDDMIWGMNSDKILILEFTSLDVTAATLSALLRSE